MPTRRLSDLPVGSSGILKEASAIDGTVARLFEMGLTPGCVVEMIRRAPFGDPIEIRVRGTRLCLRKKEASAFLLEDAP